MEFLKSQRVFTGEDDLLLQFLRDRLQAAESVDLIISFIKTSGVRLLLRQLKEVPNLRILTGTYLNITEPWALRILKEECRPDAQIRLFSDPDISFHPKAWIFHYGDGREDEVIIGSSNLSRSALCEGVEWNYALKGGDAIRFRNRFEKLFENGQPLSEEVLDRYSESWIHPPVPDRKESGEKNSGPGPEIEPRNVQIEALYALKNARANGIRKGLVQAATGIGKTYLAAFDSLGRRRILFAAHREEILEQAARAFQKVHPDRTIGFLTGSRKDLDADILFASVFTLSQEKYLNENVFAPDAFDYIVVDEFHHAVSGTYQRITSYFRPDFLLGLSATPDRLDGRDVYAVCDYNVPYAISLQQAINKGILSPFRYYGIYDSTDYSEVAFRNGRYSPSELEKLYRKAGSRTKLILDHYRKHPSKRALAFCSSRAHADFMAESFNQAGIPSAAIYSGSKTDRSEVLQNLKEGKIRVLFSVDMFNEGVDVPEIDMVMMLRPTESPAVFLQQLGRGLRKSEGKEYLNVLDFIGNYRNANRIPAFLSDRSHIKAQALESLQAPANCYIDFDLELIDLFRRMEKNGMTFEQRFLEEFHRIAEMKGGRPSRMDLFEELDEDVLNQAMKKGSKNPLHLYFEFLEEHGLLSQDEKKLTENETASRMIRFLETTSMSRIYKMPVLMSFLDHGSLRAKVSAEEILKVWKEFFASNENWKDLPGVNSYQEFLKISDRAHLANIRRNPVHFLDRSSEGLFWLDEENSLNLDPGLLKFLQAEALAAIWQDIVSFRTMEYLRSRLKKKIEQKQR